MTSTTERTKEVARRYVEEVWNEGNVDGMDEILTGDQLYHDPTSDGAEELEEFEQFIRGYREALPDLRYEVDECISEGDEAAFWGRVTGTHEGPFMGVEPTGNEIDIMGIGSSGWKTAKSRNAGRTSTCSACSGNRVSIPLRWDRKPIER